jgi:hypothetical protein
MFYSYMFCVAMDVLPVQASAVPCESAFSLGKQTATPNRNPLNPALMEALQLLKYIYKQDQLNFMQDVLAREEDYRIEGEVREHAVEELLASAKIEELRDLLGNILHT